MNIENVTRLLKPSVHTELMSFHEDYDEDCDDGDGDFDTSGRAIDINPYGDPDD